MAERLDKCIATYLNIPRSEAVRLIRGGRVTADGRIVRCPSDKMNQETALAVDGRPLDSRPHLYILLNKPAGVLCVSRDPKAPTVLDLLPPSLRRKGLFPAGRLDKDTVGLVLITDDGDYAHRLLSPRRHIWKRYRAVIDGPILPEHIRQFEAGTSLASGELCQPARLQPLPDVDLSELSANYPVSFPSDSALAEVSIQEGKYHQIKRMFGVCERKVLWLKRLSIGALELDANLPEGACRLLSEEEKERVFQ